MHFEEPTQNIEGNNESENPLKSVKTPKRYRIVREYPSKQIAKGLFEKTVREQIIQSIMKHKLLSSGELFRIYLNRMGYLIFSNKLILTLYSILFLFVLDFILTLFIVNQDIRVDTPGSSLPLEVFVKPEDSNGLSEDIKSLSVSSTRLIDPVDYISFVAGNWKYRKDVDLFNPDYIIPPMLKDSEQKLPKTDIAKIHMGSDILDMQMSVFINMMKYRGSIVGYTQELKIISVDYPKDYEGLWNIYPNDTLISINGHQLTDALDIEMVRYMYSDEIVSLELKRSGAIITVVTELPVMEVGRVVSFTDSDYYTPFNRFAQLYTKNIEGRSAGISTALSYYDTYIEDVSKDRKVALSGILNPDGTVTPIAGVNLKTIQAIENEIDILFFANDVAYNFGSKGSIKFDNYSEAKRTLERYNSDITLVGVDTFDDIITYLKETANK